METVLAVKFTILTLKLFFDTTTIKIFSLLSLGG